MDAKETVQKGLDARKNVRVAEARAERYREDADVIRESYFYDRMKWQTSRRRWQQERADLEGQVQSQRRLIRQLVAEREEFRQREKQARKRQILLSAAKAVVFFVLLALARETDWIATWLVDSMLALAATYLFALIVMLTRIK
jgi:predicted RNase H-like nuclease (RuvC/YqgF family)